MRARRADSSTEAQGQFAAQKASYADDATQPNTTVGIDTPTHWRITTDNNTVNVWKVEPNTAGPFGITLDSPYVLVSVE